MLVWSDLFFNMSSIPINVPEHMNNIFVVSTSIISAFGCLRPPCGGTLTIVPSISFSNACCTPSPDTSLVIDTFSLLRAILSTSSKNIIPCCALVTS